MSFSYLLYPVRFDIASRFDGYTMYALMIFMIMNDFFLCFSLHSSRSRALVLAS